MLIAKIENNQTKKDLKNNVADELDIGSLSSAGVDYSNAGDFTEAIKCFSKVLAQSPNDKFALESRSYCYYKLGDYKNAILDINKAINIDPNDCYLYTDRATYYGETKHEDLALLDLEKAFVLAPDNAQNLYIIGLVYAHLNKHEEAIKFLLKSAENTEGEKCTAYMGAASIYNFQLKDYSKALEYINCALKNASSDYEYIDFIYSLRGIILFNLNRKAEALRDFDKALELNRNNEDAIKYKNLINVD